MKMMFTSQLYSEYEKRFPFLQAFLIFINNQNTYIYTPESYTSDSRKRKRCDDDEIDFDTHKRKKNENNNMQHVNCGNAHITRVFSNMMALLQKANVLNSFLFLIDANFYIKNSLIFQNTHLYERDHPTINHTLNECHEIAVFFRILLEDIQTYFTKIILLQSPTACNAILEIFTQKIIPLLRMSESSLNAFSFINLKTI